jgi:hypothetical protein
MPDRTPLTDLLEQARLGRLPSRKELEAIPLPPGITATGLHDRLVEVHQHKQAGANQPARQVADETDAAYRDALAAMPDTAPPTPDETDPLALAALVTRRY